MWSPPSSTCPPRTLSQNRVRDEGDNRKTTSWSPCGTKLLSCCRIKGLRVVVNERDHVVDCVYAMVVAGDTMAMFDNCSVRYLFLRALHIVNHPPFFQM